MPINTTVPISVVEYQGVEIPLHQTGTDVETQEKSISPTESQQEVTPDEGKLLSKVTVGAVSSTYVGSAVPKKATADLTVSGATVTAPAGYYASSASKSVASGSAGTPSASKGEVTNHSVSVTPSVTNTTGYITGGTKTGSAVTVSASELVSGNKPITANGTDIDVTDFATVSVAVPSDKKEEQEKSVTPTESAQDVLPDTGKVLSKVSVGAIPSTYVGSGISQDPTITASGATVTVPSGYYTTQKTKSVATGALGTVSATKGTVSDHQISITPKIEGGTAGYISATSKTGTAVTVKASDLVSGSQTITQNGTVDVTNVASAIVNVAASIHGITNIASGLYTNASDATTMTIPLGLSFTPNAIIVFKCAATTLSSTDYAIFQFGGLSTWPYKTNTNRTRWYRGTTGSTLTGSVEATSQTFTADTVTVKNAYTGGTGSRWRSGSYRWIAFEFNGTDQT